MMRPGVILYILWCLLVVAGWLTGVHYGYSPFADGARVAGAQSAYGPQHK
jgi:hypothetical protein